MHGTLILKFTLRPIIHFQGQYKRHKLRDEAFIFTFMHLSILGNCNNGSTIQSSRVSFKRIDFPRIFKLYKVQSPFGRNRVDENISQQTNQNPDEFD